LYASSEERLVEEIHTAALDPSSWLEALADQIGLLQDGLIRRRVSRRAEPVKLMMRLTGRTGA
jgi:hypothetical protein